jgi:hypothetical protein
MDVLGCGLATARLASLSTRGKLIDGAVAKAHDPQTSIHYFKGETQMPSKKFRLRDVATAMILSGGLMTAHAAVAQDAAKCTAKAAACAPKAAAVCAAKCAPKCAATAAPKCAAKTPMKKKMHKKHKMAH